MTELADLEKRTAHEFKERFLDPASSNMTNEDVHSAFTGAFAYQKLMLGLAWRHFIKTLWSSAKRKISFCRDDD